MQTVSTVVGFIGGVILSCVIVISLAILISYGALRLWEAHQKRTQPRYSPPSKGLLDEFVDERTPDLSTEIGHYVKGCICDRCQYNVKHGGINMYPFLDTPLWDVVLGITSPIAGCSCIACVDGRDNHVTEMTPAEARAKLEMWNKPYGYAL